MSVGGRSDAGCGAGDGGGAASDGGLDGIDRCLNAGRRRWRSDDHRGKGDQTCRDRGTGGDVDRCRVAVDRDGDDGTWDDGRFGWDLIRLRDLVRDGADLVGRGSHDDGLGCDGGTECGGLSDGCGGHGHVDGGSWRRGHGDDDGRLFAIDAEGVCGEALRLDDDRKRHEGQGGDSGEHGGDEVD